MRFNCARAIASRQWADISPVDWHVSVQNVSPIPSGSGYDSSEGASSVIGQQIALQSVDLNNKNAMVSNSRKQIRMSSQLVHSPAVIQEPQRNTESKPHSERLEPKKPLRTLFLNPPSFEKFDGGASSRWPATREIESYWYPVWLTYPAGMLEGSRLVDAPPHRISWLDVVDILKDYEFLVLFTSTVGWDGDQGMSEFIKETYPAIKIAFVGPPVTTSPGKALNQCSAIDFICRREFDLSIVEYANGKPLNEILGVSYKDANGVIQHNPDRAQLTPEQLDDMP